MAIITRGTEPRREVEMGRVLSVAAVALLALVATACGQGSQTATTRGTPTTIEAPSPTVLTADVTTTAPGENGEDEEDEDPDEAAAEDFDPADFDQASINIDNPYLPLQPGVRLVYEGSVDEDGERIPHSIVSIVTDLIKVIEGVHSVVVWERDFADEELVEAELAFFAQDKVGNVWRMGEYPEEYEDGEVLEAPAWISGVEDAVAGISMQAVPLVGTSSYSQGWGPEVDFIDRARVADTDLEDCVATGCYVEVLRTEEFNVEEPGVVQLKYYAPDLGNIRTGWKGEDESKEELELVEIVRLTAAEMAEVRASALALEVRAYVTSKLVYGTTPPSEVR